MTIPSLQHLERLLALLQTLGSESIEMESHQYDGPAFGNFVVVLAKGRARVSFVWNGKESILTVESQEVQNKADKQTWEHDAFIKVSSADDVFAEIGSNAEAMLL